VPGDIISIKLGDIIPADARLLVGDPLKIDQVLSAIHTEVTCSFSSSYLGFVITRFGLLFIVRPDWRITASHQRSW
jgi:hypothetical protein